MVWAYEAQTGLQPTAIALTRVRCTAITIPVIRAVYVQAICQAMLIIIITAGIMVHTITQGLGLA